MIRATVIQAAALLAAIIVMPSPLHALSISQLWNMPSRLTPAEACEVLRREADGGTIAPQELFEAEKYLRTDGGVSLSHYVVTEVLKRFLVRRVHDRSGAVRVRTFPPVLQWLEASAGSNRLRLRGESVQVAVLNSRANYAATVLYHQTILQDWSLCEGVLSLTRVAGPLRENAVYELSAPTVSAIPGEARSSDLVLATDLAGWLHSPAEPAGADRGLLGGACDPMPTEVVISRPSPSVISLRHRVGQTAAGKSNWILCSFLARRSDATARLTYLVSGTAAAPPASASRSAVRNNPLDFPLFEPASRR
jgi:hypothetical protein